MPDISTVLHFEGHGLTFLESNESELLIRASDLALPMEVNRDAVRHQVRHLDTSDVRVISIHTNKGSRNATFLTRSGALQVMATGRSEKCRRLRKVICDFFVEWMDGKHRNAPDIRPLLEEVARLGRAVIALTEEVAELRKPALRPLQHRLKRYSPEDLHVLGPGDTARLQRDGFLTSGAFLQDTTRQKPAGPVAGGLTNRCVNWCKRNGGEIRRYLQSGQVLTFFPRDVLAKVYDQGLVVGQLLLTAPVPTRKEA